MNSRRLEYFAIGMIAGTVLGVLLGILFAPTSGAVVRRRLADEASKVAETARTVASRAESAVEALGTQMDRYLGKDEEIAWRKVHEIREGVQRYSATIMTS